MKTIYHKHHIIPRHSGGSDDPENIEKITIEEHANRHRELWEMYGKWEDEVAWKCLSGQITVAAAIKEAQIKSNLGNTNFLGKTHTPEIRARISESQKEKMKGNQRALNREITEEYRQLMSLLLKGNTNKLGKKGYKISREGRENMANSRRGKPLSEEHRKNLSIAATGRIMTRESILKQTEKVSKSYHIIDPKGVEYDIKNLKKFCRENDLNHGNMASCGRGVKKQYKGWKCSKIDPLTTPTS